MAATHIGLHLQTTTLTNIHHVAETKITIPHPPSQLDEGNTNNNKYHKTDPYNPNPPQEQSTSTNIMA